MRTLVAIFLFASLFIGSMFADSRTFTNLGSDSLADISRTDIPVDSIIDIDSLLNDTTVFKLVSDTLTHDDSMSVNADTLVSDTVKIIPNDTVVVKKTDSVATKPKVPKKPVVVIPQSVIKLNKIYSDYGKYLDFAQDRWDDIYLSLSEIKMKSDYYKFVVPLTYYSRAFEEASSVDGWYPKDIIVEDSVRKTSLLEKGMPHMPVSSELDKRINRQLLDFYVNYPELVKKNETCLDSLDFLSLEDMTSASREDNIISLIDNNAGFAQMSESDLLVLKPNFWTCGGNGYLQFSQNYISENWYKGGESTKSLLSV